MTANEEPLLREVSLKIPDEIYATSFAISVLQDFDSIEEYILSLMLRDIELIREGSVGMEGREK
jgi:hypothetical protein